MKKLIILAAAIMLTGCASIMGENKAEYVYIAAFDDDGDEVKAKCLVTNDEGTTRTRSNRSVKIEKDKDEILVTCHNDTHRGEAVNNEAGVSFGFWAADFFLLDLCIISCWIDGLSGAWVNMPHRIEVNMDLKDEDDDEDDEDEEVTQ